MNNLVLKDKISICFLFALEIIFCFTPLGSIPIGPIVATLSALPVIIASLTYGKKCGMLMGAMFAIFSFIYWSFIMPAHPTAFLFSPLASFAVYKGNFASLIICFVPRILAGLVPAIVMDLHKMESLGRTKSMVIASIIGSLTNTILVLLFIILFFANAYEAIAGKAIITVVLITILTNGIPEAVIAAIICPVISNVIYKINNRGK